MAVGKRTTADLPAAGTYRLRAMAGVTGVDDGPPPVLGTALVSIKPNPFNPQTRIVFDLEATGPRAGTRPSGTAATTTGRRRRAASTWRA